MKELLLQKPCSRIPCWSCQGRKTFMCDKKTEKDISCSVQRRGGGRQYELHSSKLWRTVYAAVCPQSRVKMVCSRVFLGNIECRLTKDLNETYQSCGFLRNELRRGELLRMYLPLKSFSQVLVLQCVQMMLI